jgi:hypothetical protein
MIRPVLFKTIVYWTVVFLVRFLEKLVEYLFTGGTLSEIPEYVATHFTWHRFAAIQIWIFVLFLIYTSVAELNARLGDGELRKIFSPGFIGNEADDADNGSRASLATVIADRCDFWPRGFNDGLSLISRR